MTVAFKGPADSDTLVEGVISYDNEQLTIEYERDRWFRQPELVQAVIPVDDIDYAEYRNGLFGGKIRVRVLYFDDARKLPWRKGLTLDFVIARKERERAADLVEQIETEIERLEDQR